jgi:hypothetical protein
MQRNRMLAISLAVWTAAVALTLAVGCASGPPPAAAMPWDQARATQLAEEISRGADAWQLEVRRANPDRLGGGSSEEGMGLTEKANIVSEQARALASHLKAGQGRDQTYDSFRGLKEVMDDVEEMQPRTALGEQVPLAWGKITTAFAQLKPYYQK